MIFSNGLDDKVRDGSKTQTRRLVKEGDFGQFYFKNGKRIQYVGNGHGIDWRLKWETGRTYAIQSGRGKKGNGRFRITKIRKESLQWISDEDIIAEGFYCYEDIGSAVLDELEPNREAFIETWNGLHPTGKRWEANPLVWVLEIGNVENN